MTIYDATEQAYKNGYVNALCDILKEYNNNKKPIVDLVNELAQKEGITKLL